MQQHSFGKLWPVSALTLGGGGLGMVWGETTFEECVATVHDAVAAGINLIDLAPSYGNGKAEEVVGAAFDGRLPEGVRVTSKCGLGNAPRRFDAGAVTREAGQSAPGGPAAVAVHDDRDMEACFSFKSTLHYKVSIQKN